MDYEDYIDESVKVGGGNVFHGKQVLDIMRRSDECSNRSIELSIYCYTFIISYIKGVSH